ncbi:MAG: hypothetical protein WDZ59_11030 [Pirellulales bacterium]
MVKKKSRDANSPRNHSKRGADLDSPRANSYSGEPELAANADALQDAPAAQSCQTGPEDVSRDREDLATAYRALEEAKRNWETDIQRRKAELEVLVQELAHQRDQFIAERRALETQRKSLHSAKHDEPAEEPSAGLQPPVDVFQQNKSIYRAFREVRGHTPDQSAAFAAEEQEQFFRRGAEDAPLDAASVIAKFQGGPAWHEEEEVDPSREADASRPADEAMARNANGKQAAAEDGEARRPDDNEESIEQYMSRLLTRVRGSSTYDPATVGPRRGTAPLPQRPRETIAPPAPPSPPQAEQPPAYPERLTELPQRALRPELTSNLAAMRALANQSANTAIDRHTRTRWEVAGRGKMLVTIFAFLSAVLLIWWAPPADHVANIAAGLALSIGVFWGMQGVMILYGVRRQTERERAQQNDRNERYSRESAASEETSTTESESAHDEEPVAAGAPD